MIPCRSMRQIGMELIRFRSKTNVIFQSNEYDLLLIITNILNTISNRYEGKNSEQLFDRMRSRGCAYINFDTRN